MEEEEKDEAGIVALIFSFLFPLLGIILYFVKKNEVTNPGSYINFALGGIVAGIILRLIVGGCQSYL